MLSESQDPATLEVLATISRLTIHPSVGISPYAKSQTARNSTLHFPESLQLRIKHQFREIFEMSPPKEFTSKIHRQFRAAHEGHRSHAGLDPTRASTGVIWCTERAYELGFADEPEKWANLGQGAPEVDDDIEGSFERPSSVDVSMSGREYGPTAGIRKLREKVAELYK